MILVDDIVKYCAMKEKKDKEERGVVRQSRAGPTKPNELLPKRAHTCVRVEKLSRKAPSHLDGGIVLNK